MGRHTQGRRHPHGAQNLRAEADVNQVTLSWHALPKAAHYEYSWSKDNYYQDWQSIGLTSYTIRGLSAIPHTFWVRGVNHVSYGPQSEVSATPLAPPPPDPDPPADGGTQPEPSQPEPPAGPHPAAPAWMTAEPGWGQYGGQVTLTWAAVANAERYECQSLEAGNSEWWDEFPHCPISHTSVTIDAYPQTGYDFRARAYRTVDGTRYYGEWTYTFIKHWDWTWD